MVNQSTEGISQLHKCLEYPAVQAWLFDESVERILKLWAERETYLNALDRLPRTLCHHDAFRRNLLVRRSANGLYQIVAIDWAKMGTGAIGEEIATFIAVSLRFMAVEMARVQEFETTAFEAYLSGLSDAGWRGDPRLVRFGFAAVAAMLYGVATVIIPIIIMLEPNSIELIEQTLGYSFEAITQQLAQLQEYLLDLGEARALLPQL